MAEYKPRKLAEVDVVAEPADGANVLIEQDGEIKRAPKTAVGGGGKPVVFYVSNYHFTNLTVTAEEIVDAYFSGRMYCEDINHDFPTPMKVVGFKISLGIASAVCQNGISNNIDNITYEQLRTAFDSYLS